MGWEPFERLYSRYDSWFSRNAVTAGNEVKALLRAVEGAGRPCVEVGSGTGFFTSRLGCLGVEPSVNMARLALGRGVQSVQGRAEALPLRDSSVGAVIFVVTLCFISDPVAAVAEASRVLARGGLLVSCIVTRSSPWGQHYMGLGRAGHPFYSLAKFYDVDEVESMAVSAGLMPEGHFATLTYGPLDEPREEEPRPYTGVEGFVCSRFRKA